MCVLAKFPEDRVIAYADDGYIKAKLSVALQVLAELKRVLKEDAGLELNVSQDLRHYPTGCFRCGAQHHQRQPRIDSPQWGCCSRLVVS